jgi:hypothetical protein
VPNVVVLFRNLPKPFKNFDSANVEPNNSKTNSVLPVLQRGGFRLFLIQSQVKSDIDFLLSLYALIYFLSLISK